MKDKELREGEFIIKRSSFLEEQDYKKEVVVTTNNLLSDLLRMIGIGKEELKDQAFIYTYKVGKDTDVPYQDFTETRKLETYKAYGIKVLQVETTPTYTRLLIPRKEVNYTQTKGEPGTRSYIPSTFNWIRDFSPKSRFKGFRQDD